MAITYEYHSAGSPVRMMEKVDGFVVNEYTAYIDRHGNTWTLYPLRMVRPCRAVTFSKKTISVRNSVVLPPIKPIVIHTPKPEDAAKATPDEQVTLL